MQKSESIGAISMALVKAQGMVEHAHKNATNPHFKNRYADLTEVIDTVKPALSANGIAVLQFPGYVDGVTTLETVLLHISGEWISGTAGARMQRDDPQGVGSALTYLRRYSLAAVCGISQDDDDGEAASKPVPRSARQEAANYEAHAAVAERTGRPEEIAPKSNQTPPPEQRGAFSLDSYPHKGGHKAGAEEEQTWRQLASDDKGRGYIRWALGKWTDFAPETRTALSALLEQQKGSATEAVILQDRLNAAIAVDAISFDQAERIEGAINDGNKENMKVALDFIEKALEKKKLYGASV